VGFLGCSGGERKCCFYSGRRRVIDYRVCVIDYHVKNNILGAPDSGVIDYRVSIIDYRISIIDYDGKN